MAYLWIAIGGYLLGSSSMAYYLARWQRVDTRQSGTGNLGASNTAILLGWRAGILVGLHDVGKGALAVLLAQWLFPDLPLAGALGGVSCVLGHIFPFYLKGRGGKGFAAYLGMTLALDWPLGLGVIALAVLITWLVDYVVPATLATIVLVPVYLGVARQSLPLGLLLGLASLVMLLKHRDNLRRFLAGEEVGLRSTLRGEHKIK